MQSEQSAAVSTSTVLSGMAMPSAHVRLMLQRHMLQPCHDHRCTQSNPPPPQPGIIRLSTSITLPACLQDLLSALTKSNVTENNWAALLAGRLTLGCTSPMHPRDSLPFAPPRGREAATYATLPVEKR